MTFHTFAGGFLLLQKVKKISFFLDFLRLLQEKPIPHYNDLFKVLCKVLCLQKRLNEFNLTLDSPSMV